MILSRVRLAVAFAIALTMIASGSSAVFAGLSVEPSAPPSLSTLSAPGIGGSPVPNEGSSTVEVAPAYVPANAPAVLGPEPPSAPMTVLVGLAPDHPEGLASEVDALSLPGSPDYRHFQSVEQLTTEYGPSSLSIATAQAYFADFGLDVTVSPDHLVLAVSGTSQMVGDAFGTTFERYRTSSGGWVVSHPTPATLPDGVPWSGVYGLGNSTPLTPQVSATTSRAIVPDPACSSGAGAVVPCAMWTAYNLSALIGAGTNGSGFRIAVVDAYSSDENQASLSTDLATFTSATGLMPGSVSFVYPVPNSGNLNASSNPDWQAEDALDLEWARAAAPGAAIDMTFSPNAGVGLYEAVDWIVAHQAANVISMSWGEPDQGVYDAYNGSCSLACNASSDGSFALLSPVLAFAAAEGISVVAASGDCGAADGTSGVSTNFPASDPDVIGVGGTVLNVGPGGSYVSETGWSGNETGARSPGCTNAGGSGGGYSPFPRPWWQASALPRSDLRGVPDVALDAATGAYVVIGGNGFAIGGTSLGTPIWAGIAAIADQAAGHPLGFLDPALYSIAAGANYSRDFHDVVQGNNGYAAGPGWDPVTGLGSPIVDNLVPDLLHAAGTVASGLSTFVYATPRFGLAPLSVTFRVVTVGGSGTYPLTGVSFGDGTSGPVVADETNHTFTAPGVYTAQSYVFDSTGNLSVAPPVAIVVGGGHALTVSLDVSTTSPSVGTGILLTATASGGTAPYEYNFSFGDGTYLDGSTSSVASHAFGAAGGFCAAVVVSDSALRPDGAASARVALKVGGAAVPDCQNDTVPLSVSALPGVAPRDAPADFPALFSITGGSTAAGGLAPSVQYTSNDPYSAACECDIFRNPGTYTVTGYVNDSEGEQATATTVLTVNPPLIANFSMSPPVPVGPGAVTFRASASGGVEANAGNTTWTFGNGRTAQGAVVTTSYLNPGEYVAVAALSDRGNGNASEAFLIDVRSSTPSNLPTLTGSVEPAVDVPLGSTVNFTIGEAAANGSPLSARPSWNVGNGTTSFAPSFNWTFSNPFPGETNRTLVASAEVTDLASGAEQRATFDLTSFVALEANGFTPRSNALDLTLAAPADLGPAPFPWTARSVLLGPGSLATDWKFGDGTSEAAAAVTHVYPAGAYSVTVAASDSFGDLAYDDRAVTATQPLSVNADVVPTSGGAPLVVTFHASASLGVGPPYSYEWTFGDGGTSGSANGVHYYANAGMYLIELTSFDGANDVAGHQWVVTVVGSGNGTHGEFPAGTFLAIAAIAGVGVAIAVVVARREPLRPET